MEALVYVRKHRAPKGALRPVDARHTGSTLILSQKAPSAKRCIKTSCLFSVMTISVPGQKAPSAKRCIKTAALRRAVAMICVRKHRAPKGALRPGTARTSHAGDHPRQKAPSAKRCIKTPAPDPW